MSILIFIGSPSGIDPVILDTPLPPPPPVSPIAISHVSVIARNMIKLVFTERFVNKQNSLALENYSITGGTFVDILDVYTYSDRLVRILYLKCFGLVEAEEYTVTIQPDTLFLSDGSTSLVMLKKI